MFLSPLFLIITIPPLLLGLWAQYRVKSNFKKFSKVTTRAGVSGAQVARRILDESGLSHVKVERVQGFLSDHYDPRNKVLRLSPDVHDGRSISAVGVAAHEAGHALQDKKNYFPLRARSAMVPTVQFGSWLGPILFMAGYFLQFTGLAWVGVILFGGTAAFALVTLPVEFDASSRAKAILLKAGMVTSQESAGVSTMLNAAAMTYVAAAIQAIANLLYYVLLLTSGNRD